ncbi:hypothetical protein [Streptomyces olivochromogenes]|uniref:hypothetical protein n=1 Tax=Streptomyces olivochromogenes TaxID=1963 RepID=UPI001F165014|nr:hypothetical protein [Streptomyces olivochromogenes]MCF3137518.1 hypothetical protein [Streptomyces olivochromogenes]
MRPAGEETRTPSWYRAAWTMLPASAGSPPGGSAGDAEGVAEGCGWFRARRQTDLRWFFSAMSAPPREPGSA